jgi:hypothetical protein
MGIGPWILGGGVVATALAVGGLFVGAGSWLSDTPPWRTGFRVMAGLLIASWAVVFGGAAAAVVAKEQGWVGPKYWFTLEVPAGYEGQALIRWCPGEGEPFGEVVHVDPLGIATVAAPMPPVDDRWEFDVVRSDGSRTSGYRASTWPGGCESMVVAIADEPWTVMGGQSDPAVYLEMARDESLPFSRVSRRLPYHLVVPDGYRGDFVVEHCVNGPTPGRVVEVGPTGIVTLDQPLFVGDVHPEPFPLRERSGAVIEGHLLRVEYGPCTYAEVRAGPKGGGSTTPGTVAERVAAARAAGVPYGGG